MGVRTGVGIGMGVGKGVNKGAGKGEGTSDSMGVGMGFLPGLYYPERLQRLFLMSPIPSCCTSLPADSTTLDQRLQART